DEIVARAEHHELAALDRAALGPGEAAAGEHVGERAEGGIPRQGDLRARGEGRVCVRDRSVCDAGPGESRDLAGDETDQRTAVVGGEEPEGVASNRPRARGG